MLRLILTEGWLKTPGAKSPSGRITGRNTRTFYEYLRVSNKRIFNDISRDIQGIFYSYVEGICRFGIFAEYSRSNPEIPT